MNKVTIEAELDVDMIAFGARNDADAAFALIRAIDEGQCTVEFTTRVYEHAWRVLMYEDVLSTSTVEAFRTAWNAADAAGAVGRRVEAGLLAVKPLLESEVREQIVGELESAARDLEVDGLLPDETIAGRSIRLVRAQGIHDALAIVRAAVPR